jgi:valyl-tRNA synthetase
VPAGFTSDQRGVPDGFIGDPDVMDTWATSSLSPFIVCGWERDPELFARTFPMDLRPQAHDIIRTWLFSTVVRSHLELNALPWSNAAISGWVLDPDRKKMSKSKGNVVTPMGLLEEHGSDAVRYWAAKGGPGVDTAFEPGQMKVGRRLAIKLLNASKFVLARTGPTGPVTEAIDRGMLADLDALVRRATAALDDYDYATALRETESFFWTFCDYYIELVKRRRQGDDQAAHSAISASQTALSVLLRLFAPFMPFVTEEVWSWWQEGSVHRAPWPHAAELAGVTGQPDDQRAYAYAIDITTRIREQRSALKLGFGVPVPAAIRLHNGFDKVWEILEGDVYGGNNASAAGVTFDAAEGTPIEVQLTPLAAPEG